MIKREQLLILGAAMIFGLLFSSCGKQVKEKPVRAFQAGASSGTINPEMGSFIAGDAPNRRFTGIHDSIYAKAVVMKSGEKAIAIVTLDCIGLLYPDVERIRNLAADQVDQFDLPPQQIIVSSNHIHSGPDVVGIWGEDQVHSGVDSLYMDNLIHTAAAQVKRAANRLESAQAFYVSGTFGEQWVHNISEPEEIDRSLTVLQLTDPSGQNIATLTNFACHPTFFDAVHTEVSADYVGAFYEDMSVDMAGEHLFLQGAIGGWVQPDKEDQSYEIGWKRGGELSAKVKGLLASKRTLDSTSIDFRNVVFDLPVSDPGWSQLSQLGVIKREIGEMTKTEIAWFRIGPAQFITHPGETPPSFSFASKEMMQTEPKFVMGLTLDAMGYILKPEYFDPENELPHSEYLTRMSPGVEAGPLVMEKVEEVIRK